jgi:hypothetical protein
MVKRLRVEEESEESKVKRLCNKLRGDAREVSPSELEEVANAVEEIRCRITTPFTIQELIATAPDSALSDIREGSICRSSNVDAKLTTVFRLLVPEYRNIEQCVAILQDAHSDLYAKLAVAYAKEYNTRYGKQAGLDNVAFRNAVEGQLKMREHQRLMDEARAAAHQLAHELARNMTLNNSQRDVEMSN